MDKIPTKVYTTDTPDNVLIWEGAVPFKLSVGDMIFYGDGWGGAQIRRAYYDLDGDQELYIDDHTNEMKEHVKKYGLFNINRGEHGTRHPNPTRKDSHE